MIGPPIDFLLSAADPWVVHRTRVDLLGEDDEAGHRRVVEHPRVAGLLREAARWPGRSVADHKAAKDLLNRVAVLGEFGVRRGDAGCDAFAERVLAHRDEAGRVLSFVVMPRQPRGEWRLDVDGPEPLIALCELGYGDDPRVQEAIAALVAMSLPDGGFVWPDAPSPLPCRRPVGGCPYPTTKMLRLFSFDRRAARSTAARRGVELLLDLADRRESRYGFGLGEKFLRLKYPFIWFDLLHVLDALSRYPVARRDPRYRRLLESAVAQGDEQGRYVPGSVWLEWRGCCFAQKREPSPWLTYCVHRIVARGRR